MSIIFDYKWYFFLFCILLGLVYALVFYFKNKDSILSTKATIALGVLRFCSASLLAFLFLSPLVKQKLTHKEKPIIIIGQDNSASLLYCKDSAFYKGEYQTLLSNTIADLQKDYEVHSYLFGQSTKTGNEVTFTDNKTDISNFVDEIKNRYINRNVGAIVLASDGIYNSGTLPTNNIDKLLPPIYTIAMGDTTSRKDATIYHLKYNKIAYLGNKFPIEITIKATKLDGKTRKLSIAKDGKVLQTKDIVYTGDRFSTTEQFIFDADTKGLQHYTIHIEPTDDEISIGNNYRTMTVDIIDNRQKIAIIANSPHPDVAALKRCIDDNENYEVESFLAGDFKNAAEKYNLIILHQLPSNNVRNNEVVEKIMKAKVPALFVVGEQTDLTRLNNQKAGLQIYSKINKTNESQALYNKDFTLFTFPQEVYEKIEQFPPLSTPFGEYKTTTNAQNLFNAKIGTITDGNPIITFVQLHDVRYGFVVGEGIWRWALADYMQNNSHQNFNTLIDKAVMYLSLRVNKDQLRITTQNSYRDNEPIIFEGELYNENFEPINTPDITLKLSTPEGNTKEYQFNQTNNNYHLNIGSMAAGKYTYTATTTYNNKDLSAAGAFVVEESKLEDINLVADHTMLNTMATKTNGKLIYPKDIAQITEIIRDNNEVKSVIYEEEKYSEVLNMPLILVLIIMLLGTEWVARKYCGEI